MPVTDLTTLIAQVGFPIAVAIYMLGRTDKRLDALTTAIQELNNLLKNAIRRDDS